MIVLPMIRTIGVTIKMPSRSVENHENQKTKDGVALKTVAIVALQKVPIAAAAVNQISPSVFTNDTLQLVRVRTSHNAIVPSAMFAIV